MSAVCVLTPMLIGAWPSIAAAIAGVAGTLGFAVASKKTTGSISGSSVNESSGNKVETEFPHSEILDSVAGEQQFMCISKDGVTIEFRRDERGACSLCVSGSRSKSELQKIGEEVAGRVVQQFAYHKLVTELKKRNYSVVDEKLQQDKSIRMRIRLNG